uniref:Uncharacterized protein n=1 Tax=Cucumis sativus TaxID=3659 RepID=A0A0A0LG18_CUCSA
MDFNTLSRREHQALCKRNKIPANITNVIMADTLPSVERIKEFFNKARDTRESENRDLIVASTTLSFPGGWRRTVAASSACKKVDFQMMVDDQ